MELLLHEILMLEEDSEIELKSGKDKIPLSLFETYSAFANTKGGIIYLGIQENKHPPHVFEGVINAKQKRKNLFDLFNNKQKVSCSVVNEEDVSILSFPDGDLIRIVVHEASRDDKPVYINGDIRQSYFRNDSGDHVMDEATIQSLINDKSDMKFDQKPNKLNITIDDLDEDSLNQFINIIKTAGKLPINSDLDVLTILRRCGGVTRDEKSGQYLLNNGAILFLGKTSDVNTICPTLWMDYAFINDNDERWSDRVTTKDLVCEGNIFQFYIRSLNKAVSYSPSPYLLVDTQDVGKKKVLEIIREAFANSISNLDLFEQTGLTIKQSNNNIVFKNAGTMLVPLDEALLGGRSKPRNPSLFAFFQAMGVSDHGGYGIPNIFDNAKMLNYLPPVINEDKVKKETTLIINFRSKTKELTDEEELIIRVVSSHSDGLSVLEIANLCQLGRDKTRRLVESLFAMKILTTNGKTSKGKKYLISK